MAIDMGKSKSGFFKTQDNTPFGISKAENISTDIVDGVQSRTTYSGITHTAGPVSDDVDGGDAVD